MGIRFDVNSLWWEFVCSHLFWRAVFLETVNNDQQPPRAGINDAKSRWKRRRSSDYYMDDKAKNHSVGLSRRQIRRLIRRDTGLFFHHSVSHSRTIISIKEANSAFFWWQQVYGIPCPFVALRPVGLFAALFTSREFVDDVSMCSLSSSTCFTLNSPFNSFSQ